MSVTLLLPVGRWTSVQACISTENIREVKTLPTCFLKIILPYLKLHRHQKQIKSGVAGWGVIPNYVNCLQKSVSVCMLGGWGMGDATLPQTCLPGSDAYALSDPL